MNVDELRDRIWERLYQAKATKSVDEIAVLTKCESQAVRAAVKHEWFAVNDDQVSIAYAEPRMNTSR